MDRTRTEFASQLKKSKGKCGQELEKELGRDRDAQCMHGVC